jgi:hypothetical protein
MSHIVTIKTEVRDATAVRRACLRLGLPQPAERTVKLYSGKATGLAVQLPEWVYPLVCDTATGKMQYDNFNGRWGDQKELDRFLQGYAVEKAKIAAQAQGHPVTEQSLSDGSIKLVIQLDGGAA